MISIIICSIDPERLANVSQNIAQTIGVEHEIIAIDNKIEQLSICAAYNKGAQSAKYHHLCFAHEDVLFHTQNWGKIIGEKLNEKSTGVIGFAGSTFKTKQLSSWTIDKKFTRISIVETTAKGQFTINTNPHNEEFSEVVTLDGLCLFVRSDVWAQTKFDDKTLRGFHLYDLDFTTAVSTAGYKNYTCHTVMVEHLSSGSFDSKWYENALLYTQKWEEKLPIFAGNFSTTQIEKIEKNTFLGVAYLLIKKRILPREEAWRLVKKCFAKQKIALKSIDIYLRFQREKTKMK